MEIVSNATRVRKFIDKGSLRPTTTAEFMEFWKACSMEDRQAFNDQAVALESKGA